MLSLMKIIKNEYFQHLKDYYYKVSVITTMFILKTLLSYEACGFFFAARQCYLRPTLIVADAKRRTRMALEGGKSKSKGLK